MARRACACALAWRQTAVAHQPVVVVQYANGHLHHVLQGRTTVFQHALIFGIQGQRADQSHAGQAASSKTLSLLPTLSRFEHLDVSLRPATWAGRWCEHRPPPSAGLPDGAGLTSLLGFCMYAADQASARLPGASALVRADRIHGATLYNKSIPVRQAQCITRKTASSPAHPPDSRWRRWPRCAARRPGW